MVENENFSCKVLIATDVIDNGININNKDAGVTDIVLSAADETTFIQTLGRVRIFENAPKINLYIEHYDAKKINGIWHTYYEKLRFLIIFNDLNANNPYFGPQRNMKTRRRIKPLKSNNVMNYLFSKMQDVNGSYINLLVRKSVDYSNIEREYFPMTTEFRDYFRDFEISQTAALKVLYSLNFYSKVLDLWRGNKDKDIFIKIQFSWIGFEFRQECWIDFNDKISMMNNIIAELRQKSEDKTPIWPQEQCEFTKWVLNSLNNSYCPPQNYNRNKSRYKEGKIPGKATINHVLLNAGIKYMMVTKQRINTITKKRDTVWYVVESKN